MQNSLAAFATLFTFLMSPLALLTADVSTEGPALVILPPWQDADAFLDGVGMTRIGPIRAPFGVLVDARSSSDHALLQQSGAWAVLDGALVLKLCGYE